MDLVERLAHECNGNYLTARRYSRPLFEALGEAADAPDVARELRELAVNAAFAWYDLKPRGRAAIGDLTAVRDDSKARVSALKLAVRRAWRDRVGPDDTFAWDPTEDLGLPPRKRVFRHVRGVLPIALGGAR